MRYVPIFTDDWREFFENKNAPSPDVQAKKKDSHAQPGSFVMIEPFEFSVLKRIKREFMEGPTRHCYYMKEMLPQKCCATEGIATHAKCEQLAVLEKCFRRDNIRTIRAWFFYYRGFHFVVLSGTNLLRYVCDFQIPAVDRLATKLSLSRIQHGRSWQRWQRFASKAIGPPSHPPKKRNWRNRSGSRRIWTLATFWIWQIDSSYQRGQYR